MEKKPARRSSSEYETSILTVLPNDSGRALNANEIARALRDLWGAQPALKSVYMTVLRLETNGQIVKVQRDVQRKRGGRRGWNYFKAS